MSSVTLSQENQTALKQQQQLLINLAMRQAFHVLQLPLLELSEWLKTEIESNPVLEIDLCKESFKETLSEHSKRSSLPRNKSQENLERRRKEHQENLLIAPISLYEHLMNQACLVFEERTDINLAQLLIGHLNAKGFLDTNLEDLSEVASKEKLQSILEIIQSFDPPGVGARNLQESLLLQLKHKHKENSYAATILASHFDDLIHNRLPLISKQLHIQVAKLAQIIESEIATLNLNPGSHYHFEPVVALIPDLLFICIEEKWEIEVNSSFLPKFHVAPIYTKALEENGLENEETSYLRRQIASGHWLKRIVQKRNHTLFRIGQFLLKNQLPFFNGESATLLSMTIKETAEALEMHESTIARAIAGKYIASPQGMFLLKSFFKQGIETKNGEKISNRSLREILAKTIAEEDKLQPLSDEQLSNHFQTLGIPCARRTIAKYRSSLKIAPACKRKKWHRK